MTIRTTLKKNISNISLLKKQLLNWGNKQTICLALDSNNHNEQHSSFDFLLAVNATSELKLNESKNAFEKLENYYSKTNDYIFGVLSYDLKNDIEVLNSSNFDGLQFPELYFFQATKIFIVKDNELTIQYLNSFAQEINTDYKEILATTITDFSKQKAIQLQERIAKKDYLETVRKIQQKIQQGELYEMNFCQEFYAENTTINPLYTYSKLNRVSKAPFAAYFKENSNYILGSSPERFIKKTGSKLLSQPIKGTAKRSKNKGNDTKIQEELEQDTKERSENIMIVDLVRNDMAKIALKDSVSVPELCKIYSFEQVHQMISTVTCQVKNNKNPVEVLQALFPMGSMTGAPKIAAMKLIEHYESSKRGYYSGAIGYITPTGDFDFNVIIRSLLYNSKNKYLSCSVGGAITANSLPKKEYEECLLKAKAVFEVLEGF